MHLDLTRIVRSPAAALWPLLTDAEQMNRWSSAKIEAIEVGDGGTLGGVGALRRVITPGPFSTRLIEVVRTSEPPHRFRYVVFSGAPALRSHQGTITLTEAGGQTTLRWRVDMQFAVAGLSTVSRWTIGPELERSLDGLVTLAAEPSPGLGHPAARSMPDEDLVPLRTAALAVRDEQQEIADALTAREDPKQYFARVYQLVTEAQLAHLDRGEVDHPGWVLRLIPRFHQYFRENLDKYTGARPGVPERPWQRAWAAADLGDAKRAPRQVVKGLLYGVAAHIEADLPRALAEVYREHYQQYCDYVRFRADYVRMASVFREASAALIDRMPRNFLPMSVRMARWTLPPELEDRVLRQYYDVPKRRLEAFAKGRDLVGSAALLDAA